MIKHVLMLDLGNNVTKVASADIHAPSHCVLVAADTTSSMADTAAEFLEDAVGKAEHVLFIVISDPWVLYGQIQKKIEELGLQLGDTTWYVEDFYKDFTEGSFSFRLSRKLYAMITSTDIG